VKQLRADAQRNRDQIVAVARVMFAEAGADVPMEEIARRAGVGIGTLYRRFPDRDSLVRAVVEETVRATIADARAAVDKHETAWDAFAEIVQHSLDLRLGTQLALLSDRSRHEFAVDPRVTEVRDAFLKIVEGLVSRAQAEGSMRADVGAGDVFMLLALLLRQMPHKFHEPSELVRRRSLALLLESLRRGGPGTLPGEPISADALLR
jgi:AcrR family transcriptional regulator